MIGSILAILSSVVYSVGIILIQKRLHKTNNLSISLALVIVNTIIFWPLTVLFTNLRTVNFETIIIFLMAGILNPGISAPLYFKGMKLVGATINSAVVAVNPLIASVFAILFLGESLSVENWIGIVCVVTGVIFLERYLGNPVNAKGASRKGLIVAIFASLSFAISFITRKYSLIVCNDPLLLIALGQSSSLVLWSIFSHTSKTSLLSWREFRLFWKASLFMAVGGLLGLYALSFEKVSIVNPLTQTKPLFTLFFSYLYLKEFEHISKK
jgi:DME family drug/metabolite transporter